MPSAATDSACVWPRVKSAEPCVRGATPTSIEIWRISLAERPSGRFLSTAMRWRIVAFSIFANAAAAAAFFAPKSAASGSPA